MKYVEIFDINPFHNGCGDDYYATYEMEDDIDLSNIQKLWTDYHTRNLARFDDFMEETYNAKICLAKQVYLKMS